MISREAQLGNKAIKFISKTGQLTSNQSGSGVSQAKARGPRIGLAKAPNLGHWMGL